MTICVHHENYFYEIYVDDTTLNVDKVLRFRDGPEQRGESIPLILLEQPLLVQIEHRLRKIQNERDSTEQFPLSG
jgi:hypothetical protein